MSYLGEVREAIAVLLRGIPDIGRVHDYERYAKSLDELKSLYVAEISGAPQLRGWFVRRTGATESEPFVGRRDVRHAWEIRGYMALADAMASEKAFDELIEEVRDGFRADNTLGGVVTSVAPDGEQIALVESGPVLFAGVLCHGGRLRFTTQSVFE
ncbi:hypothetical protein [Rhodocyclus tenuis]|uniref:Uncharacterized protein n=1 Tax=Rhodocyclus tenuis TaxID=1066 RepID=A0A840G961_RHOTE|nr:hypothetical protein [Rhodocyclus tenuis]MBB4248386.1 hypothetical protein [Rhodocyclus tenuis]